MSVKKIKKQIVWAVYNETSKELIRTRTREVARETKIKTADKIVRIEINGNSVSAKFVR